MLYMAPEKLSGRRADEVLCDVYALGAAALEALTLRPPRVVPEGLPRGHWASYLAGLGPPSSGTILPRLPEGVEAILVWAREPEHQRRYRSAGAMAVRLAGRPRAADVADAPPAPHPAARASANLHGCSVPSIDASSLPDSYRTSPGDTAKTCGFLMQYDGVCERGPIGYNPFYEKTFTGLA